MPRLHLTTTHPDPLVAALADRLPDFEPRASFPAVYAALRGVSGVPGRNDFYAFLASLDGSHLADDLIVRIGDHSHASRRTVVVRPRRDWDAQRAYLRRFLNRGNVHPATPISYLTAHKRVRTTRGPASAHSCEGCGERAAEWSYSGFSADEQVGWVTAISGEGFSATSLRLWSPVPSDYDPLCHSCHWERDSSGVLWGDTPRPPKPAAPAPYPVPLPANAPDWVRALADPAPTLADLASAFGSSAIDTALAARWPGVGR